MVGITNKNQLPKPLSQSIVCLSGRVHRLALQGKDDEEELHKVKLLLKIPALIFQV
jgi:hypothetical protein